MLQKIFMQLASATSSDVLLQEQSWQEIADHYRRPDRHYHSLDHIENLVTRAGSMHGTCYRITKAILYSVFYPATLSMMLPVPTTKSGVLYLL